MDTTVVETNVDKLGSILTPNLLFVVTTIISIYLYFAVAQGENWTERDIKNVTMTSWSASLSVVFSLGLLALRNGPPISYWASLPILPTTLIYGFISDLPGLDLNLEKMMKTPTGITALVISSVFAGIYLMYIIYNLFGKSYYEVFMFLLPVTVFIIWILLWLSSPDTVVRKPQEQTIGKIGQVEWNGQMIDNYGYITVPAVMGKYKLYIHHWMIALVGFFISKHQTIVSDLGLGIFWGIFVHSLASYGIDIPIS